MYNVYAQIISGSSNRQAIEDMTDFNEYHKGNITLEQCYSNFINRYNAYKYHTDYISFMNWLKSLGYRNRLYENRRKS